MKKNNRLKAPVKRAKGITGPVLRGASNWRRWGAAALMLCTLTGMQPPAMAQDPSATQANLNFVGADIESVIKAIGHYTNTTFIIDPRVKGTISLVSERPVSKSQAFQLLASSLRLQGYALVSSGGVTKVVPEADAKLQAAPIQAGAVRGDQIATQIFRLNYESAANLVPVLRPLISPNNTINANPATNSIVITDYADNLRRLGRIIASLDGPATADLDVLPIRYALASDIAVMVNRLLEQGGAAAGAAGGAGATNLLADSRTNSVIIRAPTSARASLAKSLIAKLDQPTAMPGNVHVVHLKNAEATKLAQTLRAVIASDTAATGQQTSPTPQLTQTNQPAGAAGGALGGGQQQPLAQSQQGPLPTGGPGGFIQADAATNTLIITASETLYRNLRVIIDQLDARRAQVYIESLIVEITSDKAAEFGVQWAGLSGDSTSSYRIGGITGFSSDGANLISLAVAQRAAAAGATAAAAAVVPRNGLNLGIFRQVAGQIGLGALARALETEGNANILSMPNLITLDNEEARIIVGQNVPFITGQFTTAASGGAAGVNPFQTIERKDIGLSLRVRPQISEGGTVKLQIYQETSSIAPTGTATDLVTNKRSIETNVLVDDGEMIVLGGLIEDTATDGREQVPGLGNIPIVGNLFKYQTRNRGKKNLMVFLRPTVIRSTGQSINVTGDRYDYIRNQQGIALPQPLPLLRQEGPALLPPVQNGRPIGGAMLNVLPEVVPSATPAPDAGATPGAVPGIAPGTAPGTAPGPYNR
ncbi:MAG: gspD [Herminiimonas sp.]|nr:gspD [Herminiimonas sp.]